MYPFTSHNLYTLFYIYVIFLDYSVEILVVHAMEAYFYLLPKLLPESRRLQFFFLLSKFLFASLSIWHSLLSAKWVNLGSNWKRFLGIIRERKNFCTNIFTPVHGNWWVIYDPHVFFKMPKNFFISFTEESIREDQLILLVVRVCWALVFVFWTIIL